MATIDEENVVTLNVDAFCTNTNLHEHLKLTFDSAGMLANTSVLEVKLKLQDMLNAPVCIQQLSYLNQPLIDPEIELVDLYLRHGDTLHLEFLAKVDIKRLNGCVDILKKFKSLLSQLCASDERYVYVPSLLDVEKLEDLYADLTESLEYFSEIFNKWKTVPVQAERRYFVQEQGLDYLMRIRGLSTREYAWFNQTMKELPPSLSLNNGSEHEVHSLGDDDQLYIRTDELVRTFNEWQLIVNSLILRVLWNFMETGPETNLVLQCGGLKVMIDEYLKTTEDDMYQEFFEEINENALGCLCGCVEYDKSVQQEVAANHKVLDKFVKVLGYNLDPSMSDSTEQECCLVANTLFYLTFDQEALKLLIKNGLHLKIMKNAKVQLHKLLQEIGFSKLFIVCYYCMLFWQE